MHNSSRYSDCANFAAIQPTAPLRPGMMQPHVRMDSTGPTHCFHARDQETAAALADALLECGFATVGARPTHTGVMWKR